METSSQVSLASPLSLPVTPLSILTSVSSSSHVKDASSSSPSTPQPKVTRLLAFIQIIATLLAQPQLLGKSLTDSFALLPMSTIGASKIWNVITAGFFDINPFKALVNISLFLTVGRWIETSWGASRCLLYLILVNAIGGLCTYVAMLAAFLLTRIDRFLYVQYTRAYFQSSHMLLPPSWRQFASLTTMLLFMIMRMSFSTTQSFSPVATTNGMCTALLVAVKQLIPEHEIGASAVKLSANYLPILYITLVTTLTVIGLTSLGDLFFTLAAFQFSWLYLRYFQRRNGERGDLSDSFSYASMFPEPLRTVVAIFANVGFVLFKPILMAGHVTQTESELIQQQAPVSKVASIDAERRRQRALKALDERMNATANSNEAVDSPV